MMATFSKKMKKKQEIEEKEADIFVKLDSEDSIATKKALLEILASNINMQIVAERFGEIRKEELKERGMTKRHITETANLISNLTEDLPKIKEIHPAIKIKEEKLIEEVEEEKSMNIEAAQPAAKPKRLSRENSLTVQLEEIKKRIAAL